MTRRVWIILTVILGSLALIATILVIKFLPHIQSLLTSPETILDTTAGRTNLLILGMGGPGHEGPDLTDSLIFLSLNPHTRDAVMISIPRDLWVPELRAKVNTVYFYGEQQNPQGGLSLAKATVAEIMGQPVHHALAIDFNGFTKAIDLVGGIDVNVLTAFDDLKYPIPGKETVEPESDRYEHLHFDSGPQLMDGATALKFVRSRNAPGEEGTDFARSRRQQQVIDAFKKKFLSLNTLTNLDYLPKLKQIFADSVKYDIAPDDLIAFAKLALEFKSSQLRNGILDAGDKATGRQGLLIHPAVSAQYDRQWVLIPRDSIESIHQYVSNLIFSP